MSVKTVIPVKSLGLSKADESLKVLILKTSLFGRKSLSSSIADGLAEAITSQVKDAEVKTLDAARMVIATGVSSAWPSPYNDPESEAFIPEDETPKVFDGMKQADLIIVATDADWSFPSSKMTAIIERFAGLHTAVDSGQMDFKKKLCGVVTTSHQGTSSHVGALLALLFGELGFTTPGRCVITTVGEAKDVAGLKESISTMADALVDAAMAARRA